MMRSVGFLLCLSCLMAGCGKQPINSPYSDTDGTANTLYRSMAAETGQMDPASTYSGMFIFEVLEPPFEYHPLKRPHQLVPLTATSVPEAQERLTTVAGVETNAIVYRIDIQPGIRFQDHPCFAPANHTLTHKETKKISSVRDLPDQSTRELTAEDYVLGICRLADPRLSCPIYDILEKNMLGLYAYRQRVEAELERQRDQRKAIAGIAYNREADERYDPIPIDYLALAAGLPFAQTLEKHSFEIALKHPYPQILAWMSFSFFAPVPQEALDFYAQPALIARKFDLNNDMVGTGPYVLQVSDPIHQIVLLRNKNYRDERYPTLAKPDPDDTDALANYTYMQSLGMLKDSGKRLPFIDKVVYHMEKESIPRWNKFMQGYYDESNVTPELFDETIQLSSKSDSVLTPALEALNVRMVEAMPAIVRWLEFNMGDDIVGGYDEKACKLRQALSIAYDSAEGIDLLRNGVGIVAQSPIPPGIFGQTRDRAGMNPYVFDWDEQTGKPVRKPIETAKKLLAEAGYPDGVSAEGKQLTINYMLSSMGPQTQPQITFMRRQFDKINVLLDVKLVDGNRFQRSRESGTYQMCGGGWLADYPDPENFLFLCNAPPPGEYQNESGYRYHRPDYNVLYLEMQRLPDTPERLAVIRKMLAILNHDAPSIYMEHPISYSLYHDWLYNALPDFRTGRIKYLRLDPAKREAYRDAQNQPQWGKVMIFFIIALAFSIPAFRAGLKQFRGV
jgi:oligopeptide transport system substrate-binding protein